MDHAILEGTTYVFLAYGANMKTDLVGYAKFDHRGDFLNHMSQT